MEIKGCFFPENRLINLVLVFSLTIYITLALKIEVSHAAPEAKSIFSRPKWTQPTAPPEEKASGIQPVSPKFFYPSQIKVSQDLAKVQEFYQGKNKKLIIHLQDAHCNYDGQKKAAELLKELIKNYGVRLILVEGGSGDVSLSYLRNYGTPELRKQVAEEYLRKGEIAGEEYLDIISDMPFTLYGIENDDIYNAHLDTFWRVEEVKTQMLERTAVLMTLAEQLKGRVYNKQLRELEQKKTDFEKQNIKVVDYYDYLGQLSQSLKLDLTASSNFKKFIDASRFEKDIKSEQIAADSKNLVEKLVKILPEKKLKQLLAQSAKFKLEKVAPSDYYSFLKMLALSSNVNLKAYPNLYNYLNYLELSEQINGSDLIREAKELEKNIKEKLFKTGEERELDKISVNLVLLNNLINLQLTPDEYNLYNKNKSDFRLTQWLNFLNDKAGKYKIPGIKTDTEMIVNNLGRAEEYYQLAFKRDEAILQNSLEKMGQDGDSVAVLITGGFHTPRLTRMIKEKDYSYLVIAPKITEISDQNLYISVLKNRQHLGEK